MTFQKAKVCQILKYIFDNFQVQAECQSKSRPCNHKDILLTLFVNIFLGEIGMVAGNHSTADNVRSRVQKFPAWPTFRGNRNKTTLLFFNIVSLYFNTLFSWYINLTIDVTIYPSQRFIFGAAFVCQAGNFWTLLHSRVQKFPAWPTFRGNRNKTTLLFFNIVSLYFNTLFNWYINLTIDGTIYPSQPFPFGAAFVCQAGNFWTLLRNYHIYLYRLNKVKQTRRHSVKLLIITQPRCRVETGVIH